MGLMCRMAETDLSKDMYSVPNKAAAPESFYSVPPEMEPSGLIGASAPAVPASRVVDENGYLETFAELNDGLP